MRKIEFNRDGFNKLIKNNLVRKIQKYSDKNFTLLQLIDKILDDLGIELKINTEALKKLPKSGSFICVSNKPLLGIDNLILLKIFFEKYPEYKILNENFLSTNTLLESVFIFNSDWMKALSMAKEHIDNGFPIGIFPFGNQSKIKIHKSTIDDLQRRNSIFKFIKSAHAPIVPIHIYGKKSRVQRVLDRIHPIFGNSVFSSLQRKKKSVLEVKIGSVITIKEQNEFNDYKQFGKFIRLKIDYLNSKLDVRKFFKFERRNTIRPPEKIIDAIDNQLIKDEIENSRDEHFLFSSSKFSIFCLPSEKIPNTLKQIGRLREITFREIGEGTNNSIDLDEYDLYYEQLVIWDEEKEQIVGAYRIGRGDIIVDKYGVNGFYINSLFKINRKFSSILEESVELGRSFIVKEYQRKPLSLFMLWKGILYYLLKNNQYRYLIGPVSISGEFNEISKSLIVEFIKDGYYRKDLARFIQAKKRFKLPRKFKKEFDRELFREMTHQDFKKLDKFIKDIEKNLSTPILIKKYMSLGAQIIGFNRDPDFNNCLDGLLILDLYDVPIDVLEGLSKEVKDESIMERLKYPRIFN